MDQKRGALAALAQFGPVVRGGFAAVAFGCAEFWSQCSMVLMLDLVWPGATTSVV